MKNNYDLKHCLSFKLIRDRTNIKLFHLNFINILLNELHAYYNNCYREPPPPLVCGNVFGMYEHVIVTYLCSLCYPNLDLCYFLNSQSAVSFKSHIMRGKLCNGSKKFEDS